MFYVSLISRDLFQATPENIVLFKEAVKLVNVSDKANFRKALSTAFELMIKVRQQYYFF